MKKRSVFAAVAMLAAAGVTQAQFNPAPLPASREVAGQAGTSESQLIYAPVQEEPQATPATSAPAPAEATPAPAAPAPAAQPAAQSTGQTNSTCQSTANRQPTEKERKDALLDMLHRGPTYNTWARADYLMWRAKDAPLPFTAVSSSTLPLAPTSAAIGSPGFAPVIGPANVDLGTFNGGRVTLGSWLDCCHTLGIEASGFYLGQRSSSLSAASDATGSPILGIPFTNALTGIASAQIVSAPGLLSGISTVNLTSQLWGGEASLVRNLCHDCSYDVDLLAGFRYLDLEEGLDQFSQSSVLVGGPTTFSISDSYRARNQIYGGQIGTRAEFRRGALTLDLLSKVALGPNHQRIDAVGVSSGGFPGLGVTLPGGLFGVPPATLRPNHNNWFVVVPEVEAALGVQLTTNIQMHAGYSFLYINDVIRPGNLVNTTVNLSGVPSSNLFGTLSGPNLPQQVRHTDYWAHGLNFGVTITY